MSDPLPGAEPDALEVLFIEDDPTVRKGGAQALDLAGLPVRPLETAEEALPLLQAGFSGVIVSDVKLPGMDGMALLQQALDLDTQTPVVLVTGHGDVAMAVSAMRAGAYDFIEKPCSSEHLVEVVRRALEKRRLVMENRNLRRLLDNRHGIEASILGKHPSMQRLRRQVLDVADSGADILLFGETGTGKELLARCLHEHSARRSGNFVALNCGALPETMFESELFGHEAGAFTGAAKRRIGRIEYANGGTLFLDEIESMPLALQVKLLRVLQERSVERLGSNEVIPLDIRVIAASKDDLLEKGKSGQFRSDLYYRLSVVTLKLPALRERREDIPLLFEFFVLQAAARYKRAPPQAESRLLLDLMSQDWPGNVRELKNAADRFVLGLMDSPRVDADSANKLAGSLPERVDAFERSLIAEALQQQRGQVAEASEALGVPRKTLYDKLKKYALNAESFR